MKFVSIRDFRNQSSQIWKNLSKEHHMVITSNGKPIAILSATSGDTLEESLAAFRRVRATAALEAMQKHALERGLDRLSLEEINRIINDTRKNRSK